MYSSLHKIDVVAQDEGCDLLVQTDHRSPEEILDQRELSTVFAIARLIAPRGQMPGAAVRYAFMQGAPEFLCEVIRACGASWSENGEKEAVEPARPVDFDQVSRLADAALRELGRKALEREGLTAGPEALTELEWRCRTPEAPTLEENEMGYYTQLVELAAVGGLVLEQVCPGSRWMALEKPIATVPLAFGRSSDSLLNVFGRSERYCEGEVNEGPSALVAVAGESAASEEGPLVGIIKPSDWGVGRPVLSEPLLPNGQPQDALPLIVYGHDSPRTIAYLNSDTQEITLDQAREQARAFYRGIQVKLECPRKGVPLWILHGDYYAPEKLLEPDFAQSLHDRLKSESLVVGFPSRGLAVVAPADSDPRRASVLVQSFLENAQERAAPNDRISKTPFLMLKGRLSGFVKVTPGEPPPDPPRKAGFFSRLFGW